jgi:hypothetical protein
MSEITTKVDGNSSVTKRYGAGSGGNSRPELGRWIKITNSNSSASPLFENTTAEQESMYSNISGASNISVETGQYGIEGTNTLYSNTSNMATVAEPPVGRRARHLLLMQHRLIVQAVLLMEA